MRLEEKNIIVTGGGSGNGRRFCERLVAEGARVLIADLDLEAASQTADELSGAAGEPRALAVRADVTREADVEAMIQLALERLGSIDVLVNNVGSYPHAAFDTISYQQWRQVIAVNLDSVFLCSKAAIPHMKEKGGKIINVATNLVWIGLPDMVHYVAAKAGVVGFTRALAREVGRYNITVNAIAPGAIIPPIDALSDEAIERAEEIVRHQAIRWYMRAEDLAGTVAFLSSSDADLISGQILTVDGGLTTH